MYILHIEVIGHSIPPKPVLRGMKLLNPDVYEVIYCSKCLLLYIYNRRVLVLHTGPINNTGAISIQQVNSKNMHERKQKYTKNVLQLYLAHWERYVF